MSLGQERLISRSQEQENHPNEARAGGGGHQTDEPGAGVQAQQQDPGGRGEARQYEPEAGGLG